MHFEPKKNSFLEAVLETLEGAKHKQVANHFPKAWGYALYNFLRSLCEWGVATRLKQELIAHVQQAHADEADIPISCFLASVEKVVQDSDYRIIEKAYEQFIADHIEEMERDFPDQIRLVMVGIIPIPIGKEGLEAFISQLFRRNTPPYEA